MKKLTLAILLGLSIPAAHASVFSFSYNRPFDNKILAGQLNGILQADNNSVFVTSVLDFVTLNGVPAQSLPFVYSTDFFNFGTAGLPPKVTLDGSVMDFAACHTASCSGSDVFTFNAGNLSGATFGGISGRFDAYDGPTFGAFGEQYIPARWSLSVVQQAVPEPSTLLLVFGALGSAFLRRKGNETS